MIDITNLVEEFPDPDAKVKALANEVMPGGSALNAAVTFAHLGGQADLASALGRDDLFNALLRDDLAAHGVTPINICDDPDYRIPLSTVISTRSTGSRMIVNASGDECARLRRMPELMRNGYDLIQLDQYEQPFVELHAEAIKAFDGPVVLDGGAWKAWSPDYLRLADTVVVSEAFHAGGPDGLGALCAGLGIVRWAMTRGAKGVHWYDRGRSGEIPAVKVNAIDTLGAGDIFHGAFCYFFARRGDFVGALTDASRIAAKSCTTAGTRRWMRA